MTGSAFSTNLQKIQVIDSHTGGEPTRVIIAGGPPLEGDDLLAQRNDFRNRFDAFRRAVVDEPRGSNVWIGAWLGEPQQSSSLASVIFFNTDGYLGMCGHGTIGVVKTLEYLGRLQTGWHQLDTPVGPVDVELLDDGRVAVRNVVSYRLLENVRVEVDELGTVIGDVAWGGNWFFLVKSFSEPIHLGQIDRLLTITRRIRRALAGAGVTGGDGAEIDHIELFCEPQGPGNDSRSFVLCPGGSYDRSPCGTGTSAKLACLAADGLLAPRESYRQESPIGSVFEASYEERDGKIIPTIVGSAHVMAESTLIMQPDDPFAWGIS